MAKQIKQQMTLKTFTSGLHIHMDMSADGTRPTKFKYLASGQGWNSSGNGPAIEIWWNAVIVHPNKTFPLRVTDRTVMREKGQLSESMPDLLNLLSDAIMTNTLTKDAIAYPAGDTIREPYNEAEIKENLKLIKKWNRFLAGTGWNLDTLHDLPDALNY